MVKSGLASLVLALGLLCAMVPAPATAQQRASVSVTVNGLRSAKGQVLVCLTADPRHFPKCDGDPASRKLAVPAQGPVRIAFADLPPGRYAMALVHDENVNRKMDTTLGMPKEGFAFSRDAPVKFAPPKFGAAAFDVATGPVELTVKMRYLL